MIPDEAIEVKKWLDNLPGYVRDSNNPAYMLDAFADDMEKTVSKLRILSGVWTHIIAAKAKVDELKNRYEAVEKELKEFEILKGRDK